MAETLSRDLEDLLSLFNRSEVEYLVVGGHALGVYIEPRATKDLDIWVNPSPENARRVFSALQEYGAPLEGVEESFFADRSTFLVIGVAPNRIDILKSVSGLEFDSTWRARKSFRLGSSTAYFPSLEHLLASKLAAGRPRDLLDAARLKLALDLERQFPTESPPSSHVEE